MGHQLLGRLPTTKVWNAVVALIVGNADGTQIAAAVSAAAESSLAHAANDAGLRQGFWLLTQIPLAAQAEDFGHALHTLGLDVSRDPTLIEIGAAVTASIDGVIADDPRANDLSEMAAAAAVESLVAVAGRQSGSLFGVVYTPDEARASLRALAAPPAFAVLARDFFARLTREYLGYYLSRVMPDHVGITRRFQSLQDHHRFEQALDLHCREASLIIEVFAADWFAKHSLQSTISRKKASGLPTWPSRKSGTSCKREQEPRYMRDLRVHCAGAAPEAAANA